MKKQLQLVTYEQAKKLKELGFDWKCSYYKDEHGKLYYSKEPMDFNNFKHPVYNSIYISNPQLAFALEWFRDVKRDHSFVCCDLNNV
jgi:hypothetical protein